MGSCLAVEPYVAKAIDGALELIRFSVLRVELSVLNVRVKTLYLSYLFMFMCSQWPLPLLCPICLSTRIAKLGTRPLGICYRSLPMPPTASTCPTQLCLIYFSGRAPVLALATSSCFLPCWPPLAAAAQFTVGDLFHSEAH